MTFDPAAIAAFKADAAARWPEEACGLITSAGYVACRNVAVDPMIDFAIDSSMFAAEDAADGRVLAVMHSHTHALAADGSLQPEPIDAPSLSDQMHQPSSGAPWGIACVTRSVGGETHVTDPFFFGDEMDIQPLVGRAFRWGVADCLAALRDWHRLRGIVFPNVPRWDGWEAGSDLFVENFARLGFRETGRSSPLEGDCPLMRVRSERTNHCGVYVGGGLVLHHLVGGLSRHAPISRHARQITHWVRHEDLPC